MTSANQSEFAAITQLDLPAKPGTLWDPETMGNGRLRCRNCGQGYERHGGTRDEVQAFGLPADTRSHLLCHASEEAWNDYWRRKRRSTVELYVADLVRDLRTFDPVSRDEIIAALREIVQGVRS